MRLNYEQQAVVDSDAPRICVVAGAGTGKTATLTERIARLVRDGHSPSEICAVTFTRKAAGELLSRLKGLIGTQANRLTVGTFHGLTARWIRDHVEQSASVPLTPDFGIYDATDSDLLLRLCHTEVAKNVLKRDLLGRRYTWAETRDDSHPDRFEDAFLIWASYHQRLISGNALDFDGILEIFFHMLADPDVHNRYAQRYRHILVDEFQDTNSLQFGLIRMAAEAAQSYDGHLCVVGDEKQALYSWRGADVEIIRGLQADSDWTKFFLTRNYRSSKAIVAAANRIASRINSDPPLETDKPGGRPTVIAAASRAAEARIVAGRIKEFIGWGIPASDIAVLYRVHPRYSQDTSSPAGALSAVLSETGVPFYRVGSERHLWDQEAPRQVVRLLRLAANPADDQTCWWVLNWPAPRLDRRGMIDLEAEAAATCRPLLACLPGSVDLSSLSIDRDSPLSEATGRLENHLRLVSGVANEGGWVELAYDAIEEWAAENDGATVGDFLDWFSARGLQDEIRESRESVTLCTVHAAKGLEWPIVFVIGCEDGSLPLRRKGTDLDEERRIFYVAATRARSELIVSFARTVDNGHQVETLAPSEYLEAFGGIETERHHADRASVDAKQADPFRAPDFVAGAEEADVPF